MHAYDELTADRLVSGLSTACPAPSACGARHTRHGRRFKRAASSHCLHVLHLTAESSDLPITSI
eukprot:scaffold15662_cov109-Isochrysis_galbana.AAC.10